MLFRCLIYLTKGGEYMKKILTKKGFTLIELIVVIAILAILAAILIPSISNYVDQANRSKNAANTRTYWTQIVLFEATSGSGVTATTPVAPTGGTCTGYTAGTMPTAISCDFGAYSVASPNFQAVND